MYMHVCTVLFVHFSLLCKVAIVNFLINASLLLLLVTNHCTRKILYSVFPIFLLLSWFCRVVCCLALYKLFTYLITKSKTSICVYVRAHFAGSGHDDTSWQAADIHTDSAARWDSSVWLASSRPRGVISVCRQSHRLLQLQWTSVLRMLVRLRLNDIFTHLRRCDRCTRLYHISRVRAGRLTMTTESSLISPSNNRTYAKFYTDHNHNPAAKQHTVERIRLNIVMCQPEKFSRDDVIEPFLLLSVVVVTLPL